MATYNSNYKQDGSFEYTVTNDQIFNKMFTAGPGAGYSIPNGSITVTTDSTMPWRQGDNMNIKAHFTRVKAGYLAHVLNGNTIVWESKKTYKSTEKAVNAAQKKIDNSIDKLFNK